MLRIEKISVRFPSFSIENISLVVEKHDYLALLGVSGAGKTVLLEVLAGLVKPNEGRVLLNGNDITQQRIQQRKIGLVYQDLSLFPHLTVEKNIAYPLRNRTSSSRDIRKRVHELAQQTGVSHLLDRYPGTLSGGEAQRVALARTLASDPDILLLDEPLSNLDVKLKSELRKLLRSIHASGKTVIHVTHDFMEAATLANKVAVIQDGKLVQHGTPEEVFRHPRTEFVARFSGVKNLFKCQSASLSTSEGLQKVLIEQGVEILFLAKDIPENGYVMIPQQDIIISENRVTSSAVNNLEGVIKEMILLGAGVEVVVDAGAEFVVSVSKQSQESMQLIPGKKIWLSFKASAVRYLDA
jgi:ABC-type sugar transport system ATPase subunit